MITKLQYYQGKIVVYFKEKPITVRYKILKIDKKQLDRTLHVKSAVPNYVASNELIDAMHTKVDRIIIESRAAHKIHLLNKDYIDYQIKRIDNANLSLDVNELSEVLPVYKKFLQKKTIELLIKQGYQHLDESMDVQEIRKDKEIRDQTRSVKDYISTENLLKDYQLYTNEKLHLTDIDNVFFSKLHSFAATKRDENHEYKTRKQSDPTFKKRLNCLTEFTRYLHSEYNFNIEMKSLKYLVRKRGTNIITLDSEEIAELINLRFEDRENKNWEKVRDILVFLCMTGLRYSDFVTLEKDRDLVINGKVYTIVKEAIKTRNRFEVPLNQRALEIWRKYKFNFSPHMANQTFNREVKEMLEHYKLFKDKVLIINYFRGQEIQNHEMKRKHISSHTGRRTFISACVKQNVPINRIMSMTGHKKVDTLTIYFEKWGKRTSEYVDLINI